MSNNQSLQSEPNQIVETDTAVPYENKLVVDINIHFSEYLAAREPIKFKSVGGCYGEEFRYQGYLYEELTKPNRPTRITRLFGFIPKIATPTEVTEIRDKELVLIIRERDKKNGGMNLYLDITVYEGDEKDMFADLYDRIVEHATTYIGLYNQYVQDWISLSITKHISLKKKK